MLETLDTILKILGVLSTFSTVALGLALWKHKYKKADNDGKRDDMQLSKEQMAYIDELGVQSLELRKELSNLRELYEVSESDRRRMDRERKSHKTGLEQVTKKAEDLERKVKVFYQHCKCQSKENWKRLLGI